MINSLCLNQLLAHLHAPHHPPPAPPSTASGPHAGPARGGGRAQQAQQARQSQQGMRDAGHALQPVHPPPCPAPPCRKHTVLPPLASIPHESTALPRRYNADYSPLPKLPIPVPPTPCCQACLHPILFNPTHLHHDDGCVAAGLLDVSHQVQVGKHLHRAGVTTRRQRQDRRMEQCGSDTWEQTPGLIEAGARCSRSGGASQGVTLQGVEGQLLWGWQVELGTHVCWQPREYRKERGGQQGQGCMLGRQKVQRRQQTLTPNPTPCRNTMGTSGRVLPAREAAAPVARGPALAAAPLPALSAGLLLLPCTCPCCWPCRCPSSCCWGSSRGASRKGLSRQTSASPPSSTPSPWAASPTACAAPTVAPAGTAAGSVAGSTPPCASACASAAAACAAVAARPLCPLAA